MDKLALNHLNYQTLHIKSCGCSTTSVHVDLEFYVRTRACEKRESGKRPLFKKENAKEITTVAEVLYVIKFYLNLRKL